MKKISRRRAIGMATGVAVAAPFLAACDPLRPLLAANVNGLQLPPFFTSRIVAVSGSEVAATGHPWHIFPDGGACYPTPGGGWIYVSNAEWFAAFGGGVGAIEFDAAGTIVDAYSILTGTNLNCSGGVYGSSWLSCEEIDQGLVWECDPTGAAPGMARPALGTFKHEAAALDPATGIVYLTEDQGDSGLYRFTPTVAGDLSAGLLEVATGTPAAPVWVAVPNPNPTAAETPTRHQVAGTIPFARGEGATWNTTLGRLYFTTTSDDTVWEYDPATDVFSRVYEATGSPTGDLVEPDNAASLGQAVYVCEDSDNLEIVMVRPDISDKSFPVVKLVTSAPTELAGVAFSPDGKRMYFSSQRGDDTTVPNGITYEVTGPWHIFDQPNPPR